MRVCTAAAHTGRPHPRAGPLPARPAPPHLELQLQLDSSQTPSTALCLPLVLTTPQNLKDVCVVASTTVPGYTAGKQRSPPRVTPGDRPTCRAPPPPGPTANKHSADSGFSQKLLCVSSTKSFQINSSTNYSTFYIVTHYLSGWPRYGLFNFSPIDGWAFSVLQILFKPRSVLVVLFPQRQIPPSWTARQKVMCVCWVSKRPCAFNLRKGVR